MKKTTTKRTLTIDGKIIASETAEPFSHSALEQIESIAARLELHKHTNRRGYSCNDRLNGLNALGKVRLKLFKFKFQLLDALLKNFFLKDKAAKAYHIVCLYIERELNVPSNTRN